MDPAATERDTPGLRDRKVVVGNIVLHVVEAGPEDGEAVVLLHGWPQSWYAWRRVIPALATRYRVVAPDLRGFGETSKPSTGFDTRTVGGDIVGLMDKLAIRCGHLVGHDLGAATAYAIAAGWRERVVSLAFIEMLLPGFGLEDTVRFSESGFGLWHLAFHAAPDVPEMLIAGREREYLRWFFENHAYYPPAIGAEDIDVYVTNYRRPGAVRSAMGFYRALHLSSEQNRQSAEAPLTIPVLALGGEFSIGDGVAACLRQVAENVEADVAPRCGHWVAEEQPLWLSERLLAFLAANSPALIP